FGGRFANGDHDNNDEDRFALQQGYVQWLIPIGKGIDFKIGKFATWIGAELIEDVDNPNLTHGQNYNNSIPFTHTGFSMGYDLTDNIRTTLYLVNGWDSFTDNNDAKSLGWQVAWSPSDRLSMVFNGIHGAEQANNNSDWTHLFDWVGTFVLNDKLSFLANLDYGWTDDAKGIIAGSDAPDLLQALLGVTPAPSGGDAHWAGGALTAIWTFNDYVNLATRYEYSDYTDEFGFSVWGVTTTLNIKISDNLLIRPEYRHNEVNDLTDAKGNGIGRHKGDDIFAIGFSYIF
ncbi:MAG: outer membrane beta-barrel protein, partial [Candidatus Anammoxibacter sp.]